MSRFLRYMANGFRSGLVVGAPDFSINNQYADMVNIGNDIRIAITEVAGGKRTKRSSARKSPIRRGKLRRK